MGGFEKVTRSGAVLALALVTSSASSATTTTVVDVPTRGVTQRFLYVRPDAPAANIVFLPGADGVLGILNDGNMTTIAGRCSPVVRTRNAFAARAFSVALVDQASDGKVRQYEDVLEVIRYVRGRDNVPTWLIGASAATSATVGLAADVPADQPMGVIFVSPGPGDVSRARSIKRPAAVVYHTFDQISGPLVVPLLNELTSAAVKEAIGLSGGTDLDCGFHLFEGIDAEFVAATAGFIDKHNATLIDNGSLGGPSWWWNPDENGRGFFVEKQGSNLFLAGYLYAADGRATWVMSAGPMSSTSRYEGDLLAFSGGQTLAGPYKPPQPASTAGSATLQLVDATHATLSWPGGTIPLRRFEFGAIDAPPAAGQPESGWWWSASETGRGFSLEIQGNTLFMAGYMYDAAGNPVWYLSAGSMTSASRYDGTWVEYAGGQTLTGAYRAPAVSNPSVGSVRLEFGDPRNAVLTLPDGRPLPLTRFGF